MTRKEICACLVLTQLKKNWSSVGWIWGYGGQLSFALEDLTKYHRLYLNNRKSPPYRSGGWRPEIRVSPSMVPKGCEWECIPGLSPWLGDSVFFLLVPSSSLYMFLSLYPKSPLRAYLGVLARDHSYPYTLDQSVSSIEDGCSVWLSMSAQLRVRHLPSQTDQPNKHWWSMGWQMSKPDRPQIPKFPFE